MRTATMLRILSLAAILSVACAITSVHAEENSDARPRIVECLIGYDGLYKVGYWQPIWIGIGGDVVGKSMRVEVTTLDSDGVDVTVPCGIVDTSGKSAEGIWPVL